MRISQRIELVLYIAVAVAVALAAVKTLALYS
jgi:hypothetical protein